MRVKLWAISDLHVGYEENRRAVEALPAHPGRLADHRRRHRRDAGAPRFRAADARSRRFAQLIWTPGNHDLWTPRTLPPDQRGVAHYERLVALCRRYGVLTPEDPYAALARRRTRCAPSSPRSAVRLLVPARTTVARDRRGGLGGGERGAVGGRRPARARSVSDTR